jgi:hypothetical protein
MAIATTIIVTMTVIWPAERTLLGYMAASYANREPAMVGQFSPEG